MNDFWGRSVFFWVSILVFASIVLSEQPPELRLFEAPASSSDVSENRMRIAASRYEARGDFEQALEIYRNLRYNHEGESRYDYHYYKGELRCLLGLERYDEAELLVRKEMERSLNNARYRNRRAEYTADLGQVFLKRGWDHQAMEQFDLAISIKPMDTNIYRLVSNILRQEGSQSEALEVLKRGEVRLRSGYLARDIAMLYQGMMDYGKATEYQLKYLRAQPKHFNMVERAIYGYPNRPEVQEAVLTCLKAAVNDDANVLRILTGYLFSLKRYGEALEYTLRMDNNGEELIRFGRITADEGEYELALRAYSAALGKRDSDEHFRVHIQSGVADCYRNMGKFSEAREIYWQIANEYSLSQYSEEALFRLGQMYFKERIYPDSAAYYFKRVLKLFPRGHFRGQASLELANSLILSDDIDGAIASFQNIVDNEGRRNVELWSQAMYKMGKCLLWKGEVDSAFSVWSRLSRLLPGTAAANDALYDALCLNGADSSALLKFAASWLSFERGDYPGAESGFKEISASYSGTIIGSRAAIEAARAMVQVSGGESALRYLEDYLNEFDQVELLDEIYYRMGEICLDVLQDFERARQYFEELLVETPASPRAPVVRRKLDNMRESES